MRCITYLIILVRCWVAPGLGVRERRREKQLTIITRDSAVGRGYGIVRGVRGARGRRKGTPSRTCIITPRACARGKVIGRVVVVVVVVVVVSTKIALFRDIGV